MIWLKESINAGLYNHRICSLSQSIKQFIRKSMICNAADDKKDTTHSFHQKNMICIKESINKSIKIICYIFVLKVKNNFCNQRKHYLQHCWCVMYLADNQKVLTHSFHRKYNYKIMICKKKGSIKIILPSFIVFMSLRSKTTFVIKKSMICNTVGEKKVSSQSKPKFRGSPNIFFNQTLFTFFFQLLKTSFNWELFCWLTNRRFIFSAKSKQLIFG